MKERRIRCTGSDVRAILEGKKTQTRRIVKHQQDMEFDIDDPHYGPYWLSYATDAQGEDARVRCPYGKPGDRLWVQETWQVVKVHEETESWEMPHIRWFEVTDWPEKIPKCLPAGHSLRYAADEWTQDEREEMDKPYPWRPPIFMPRWASRITLEITGIRVEQLQQISDADALAEGCSEADMRSGDSLASVYARLWDSINARNRPKLPSNPNSRRYARVKAWLERHPDTTSWDSNPWVWVVEFSNLTSIKS